MIESIFICDRCSKEHRGNKPLGWQSGVEVYMSAEGLPKYSPYYVNLNFKHLCEQCAGEMSSAISKALEPTVK